MSKAIYVPLQLSLGTVACLYASPLLAQVTSDGTVNTQVTQDGNIAEITGGETRGGNLFHSFQDFSVPTGNEAFFNNANNIANIFSRVTGGNVSNIDGLIRANGSASLFLINPAGIIFGENASLNLGGSFYGSTASSILFENGEFSAVDNLAQPLLTVNAPIGLGFRDNPGDIINRASNSGLQVNEGQNISLVGGNVSIEDGGIIFAPGGRIELGGLATAGEISIAEDNSFSFPDDVARGNVSLVDTSIVSVFSRVSGSIEVNAANLELFSGSRFIGGISAEMGSPNAQAGDIVIDATDSVLIDGQGNDNTGIFGQVRTNAIGNAGDIDITTGSLIIKNQAVVTNFSEGQGNAGNIGIVANESVSFDNNVTLSTGILSDASNNANAGNISIDTGSLSLNNNSALFTTTEAVFGDGGDITIDATEMVSLQNGSDIAISSAGGGSLTINAKSFELTSGSVIAGGIASDVKTSNAQAGDIVINTTEDVLINAEGGDSITQITNSNFGIGNAGNIEINARNISFINGGSISSFSNGLGNAGNIKLTASGDILFDGISQAQTDEGIRNLLGGIPSGFILQGTESGVTGTIDISANNLTISNGAVIQSLVNTNADSGDININVRDNISVVGQGKVERVDGTIDPGNSSISSSIADEASGNTGDINLSTTNLNVFGGASINADSFGIGNAGNIDITAENINIDGQGNIFTETIIPDGRVIRTASSSNITSNIISSIDIRSDGILAEGNGGNININTDSVSVTNGGFISVDNGGIGDSGNILINASDSVEVKGKAINFINGEESNSVSLISSDVTNTGIGNSGNVVINTANLFLDDEAAISTSTLGQGNAGSLTIRASESIKLLDRSSINVDIFEGAIGNSGDLLIETQKLNVSDGSQISASTLEQGNAGSLTIKSEFIEVKGTSDIGRSGLFATALIDDGSSGNLEIFTEDLIVRNGAIITVGNFPSIEGLVEPGTGTAGTMNIQAKSINLDTAGRIEALTQSEFGEGANINLQVTEDIILQGDSFISARAINQGDGGNLTIDSRFIIAFPDGNNDILASAEQGEGGKITINAESLLGIFERPENPQTNDINASSEVSGLDGTVEITTPDTNSIQRVTELPSNIVIPQETAQQACEANREVAAKNGLIISGKGGVVPEPGLPLNSLNVTVNGESNLTSSIPEAVETAQGKIQPARGIKVTETGEIILTAYRTNNSGERLPEIKGNCDLG